MQWKNIYDWRQLEGKLAGRIRCRVVLKVEGALCWAAGLNGMLELNVQTRRLNAFRALERNSCIIIEKRDLGSPETVIIHLDTNYLKTGNLNYVKEYVYDLLNTAKIMFSKYTVVLSGVLRRRDVSWRRIGAVNSRNEWVAKRLEVTFVDPNIWVEDWDFGRDVLHINRRFARLLRSTLQ